MTRKIVIVGAGGHARVVADIIALNKIYDLAGATDAKPAGCAAKNSGLPILGTDEILPKLPSQGVRYAALGLGSTKDNAPRLALWRKLLELGFELPSLIHPHAVVAAAVRVGRGSQIMAGAVVNAGAAIAEAVVVNTGAVVEHDCVISAGAFVGPRAALGGGVFLGEGAFVGMGACVLPGVKIGSAAVVGAGAVVLDDVPERRTVVGIPAEAA